MVEIYTSNNCRYCHQVKEFFNQYNIEFIEYNISMDNEAKERLIEKEVMGVPYIVIDGQEITGFDKAKLSDLLNLEE